MKSYQLLKRLLWLLTFISVPALHAQAVEGVDKLAIKNLNQPTTNTYSSGQPSQDQLRSLAAMGFKHIVSLRPAEELSWDEAALVSSLGMQFHTLPIAGATAINAENAAKLNTLLSALSAEPILLHCGSSNRVGALMALQAKFADKLTDNQAIEVGQAWGLSGLEILVREKFKQSGK